MRRLMAMLLLTFVSACQAMGAEIDVIGRPSPCRNPVRFFSQLVDCADPETHGAVVMLSGEIVKGDFDKFESTVREALTTRSGVLYVFLDSSGGDVNEAIRIGKLIRRLLAGTVVIGSSVFPVGWSEQKNCFLGDQCGSYFLYLNRDREWEAAYAQPGRLSRCWSACTLLLFSGVRRSVETVEDVTTFPPRILSPIGVHRPRFTSEMFGKLPIGVAKRNYDNMVSQMSEFLLDMGAPEEFVERTMATPSDDLDLINSEEFSAMLPKREGFYDEWIVSKCGSPLDALTPRERSVFIRYNERVSSRISPFKPWHYYQLETFKERFPHLIREGFMSLPERDFYSPNPEEVSVREKYYDAIKKIRTCEYFALIEHQNTWLQEF